MKGINFLKLNVMVLLVLTTLSLKSYSADVVSNKLMLRGFVFSLGAGIEAGLIGEQSENQRKDDSYAGYRYNLYLGRLVSRNSFLFLGMHLGATFNNPDLIANKTLGGSDTTGLATKSFVLGMGYLSRNWYTSMKYIYTNYELSNEEHPFGTGKSAYYSSGIELDFAKLYFQHLAIGIYIRNEKGKADLNFSNDFYSIAIGFGIQYIGF